MMRPPSHTVLLVEHDEATLLLYARELGREYQVVACSDGTSALQTLASQPVDAVVFEPEQRDGRGWEVLERIAQMAGTRLIPVILCSTQDERRRGLALGAAAYLIKPVLPATLLEHVRLSVGRCKVNQ